MATATQTVRPRPRNHRSCSQHSGRNLIPPLARARDDNGNRATPLQKCRQAWLCQLLGCPKTRGRARARGEYGIFSQGNGFRHEYTRAIVPNCLQLPCLAKLTPSGPNLTLGSHLDGSANDGNWDFSAVRCLQSERPGTPNNGRRIRHDQRLHVAVSQQPGCLTTTAALIIARCFRSKSATVRPGAHHLNSLAGRSRHTA